MDLNNGKQYKQLRQFRDEQPAEWEQHLVKLIRSRTLPVEHKLIDGYSVGTDTSGTEYRINSHGCRSKDFAEIKHKPCIVGIGCSITYGTGLDPEEIWIHKLAELMNTEYICLAMPGSGLTVTSLYAAEHILPVFENIQAVFTYTPPPNRIDMPQLTDFDESSYPILDQDIRVKSLINIIEQEPYTATDTELLRALEHTAFIQYEKDRLLLELATERHNVPNFVLDSQQFGQTDLVQHNQHTYTRARDGDHDGAELHTDIANTFYTAFTDK